MKHSASFVEGIHVTSVLRYAAVCLRRTAGWNGRHGTLKQVFSPLLLLLVFFFASVIIRHQEIIHDLVLAHGCFKKREDTGDVQSRSIWKQVFHTLIVIMAWWMFVFCLQASAWRHFFFVCVCVCLTLSSLSKLKFTMYRWTNILLLTTRSEQNQHSYCRLLTATGSEDQVVRSLLSAAVVVVVAPHFAESSLSSSSRLLFLSPPPPPR